LPASKPPHKEHALADPKPYCFDGKSSLAKMLKADGAGDESLGKHESEDEDTDTTYLRAIEAHEQRKKSQLSPDAGSSGSTPRSAENAAGTVGSGSLTSPAVKVPKLDFSSSDLFAPGRATLEDKVSAPAPEAPAAVAPHGKDTIAFDSEVHAQGHASAWRGEEATSLNPHPAPPR